MKQNEIDLLRASIASARGAVFIGESGLIYVCVGSRVCILPTENDGYRVACTDQKLDLINATVQMWFWVPTDHLVSVLSTLILSDRWVINQPDDDDQDLSPPSKEEWQKMIQSRLEYWNKQ